jgi:hypothetical protein
MDSQDRDESKIRRREATLARRMGEALDQMNPHGAGECPDAEVIAAYAEQALAPAESERWEGHFATCARCRKILRVLVASADMPLAEKEVAELGKLIAGARAPVEITPRAAERAHPKRVDWRTRWLAPALGVAAVLAVWFAMRPPWRATNGGASTTLIAQAPKEELPLSPAPAEVDRLSRDAVQQDRKTKAAPLPDRSGINAQSLTSPVEAPAKSRADAGNAVDKTSPSADEETNSLKKQEERFRAQSGAREIVPPTFPPPPAPVPKAQSAMDAPADLQSRAKAAMGAPAAAPLPQARAEVNEAAPAPPAPEVPRSSSQSVAVAGAAPQVATTNATLSGTVQQEPSADLPLNGRDYQALATLRANQMYSAVLKAPAGSILWRAGKAGTIEHSANGGGVWISQQSPSQEDWLAGAAVSETVCWLVGRRGAIARTVDGEHWERVVPPAQPAATGGPLADWMAVTARDARTATIVAGDGRKYATSDGGRTWRLQ